MGLSIVRRWFVSRSLAALLAVLVCGSAANWGHVGGDDRDCDPIVAQHDHAAHRVGADSRTTSSAGDHCYICHSLQLLHQALAKRYARIVVVVAATHLRNFEALTVRDGLHAAVPSRAPPAGRL